MNGEGFAFFRWHTIFFGGTFWTAKMDQRLNDQFLRCWRENFR